MSQLHLLSITQLLFLARTYIEYIFTYLRMKKNQLLLRSGYVLYNTKGNNIVYLEDDKQVNSSYRKDACKMDDVNWVKYNHKIHKIRGTRLSNQRR